MKSPRGFGWLASATMLALAVAGTAAAQKTQLTVYTALETDQLKAYQEGFQKANPDIEITWVRDSTGVITAKLLAEKSNPKADVVMGVAATSMRVFEQKACSCRTRRRACRESRRSTGTPKNPPAWVGWTSGARRSASTPSRRPSATSPSRRRGKSNLVLPVLRRSGTSLFGVACSRWLLDGMPPPVAAEVLAMSPPGSMNSRPDLRLLGLAAVDAPGLVLPSRSPARIRRAPISRLRGSRQVRPHRARSTLLPGRWRSARGGQVRRRPGTGPASRVCGRGSEQVAGSASRPRAPATAAIDCRR